MDEDLFAIYVALPMILRGITTVILDQMEDAVMLMKGLNFVEEQLNLLLPGNTWFVIQCLPSFSSSLMFQ